MKHGRIGVGFVIQLVAVVATMLIILYFSSQPGEISYMQSDWVLSFLEQIHIPTEVFEWINIRKCAHLFLYCLLGGFITRTVMGLYGPKQKWWLVMAICISWAALDEIRQLFSDSRGASVQDVVLDSAGAFIGLLCVTWWAARRGTSQKKPNDYED